MARRLVALRAASLPLEIYPEKPRSRFPWEAGSVAVALLAMAGWIYSAGRNSQKIDDLSESLNRSEQQLIDRLSRMEK